MIRHQNKEELHKYMTGIVREREQKLLAVHCMPDHTHLLVGLKPSMALSDLVRDVKNGSTNFINRSRWVMGRFSWQEGFGAFSYGHSEPKPAQQQTEEHPLRYALIAVLAVASLWCITPMLRYLPRHGPSHPSTAGLVLSWLVALLCLASFLWCPRRQWIQKCITALASLATIAVALSDTVASSP